MNSRRLAVWIALFLIADGLAYLVLVAAAGSFPPREPYSTLISVVTFLGVPLMPLLWVAIHETTPTRLRFYTLGSLVLLTVFTALTTINRYTALTVVPQAITLGKTEGLSWFLPYGWPSIMAAMEEQAWGGYFGLSCILLAFRFSDGGLERAIFWTLIACGAFSLISVVAQILGNSPIGLVGIIGWGPGLTLFLILIVLWFRRQPVV